MPAMQQLKDCWFPRCAAAFSPASGTDEEQEFSELLLSLAEVHPLARIHKGHFGRIVPEAWSDTSDTSGAPRRGRASPGRPDVGTKAAAERGQDGEGPEVDGGAWRDPEKPRERESAWVEDLGTSGQRGLWPRWVYEVAGSILHFLATLLISVAPPLAVPVVVQVLRGGPVSIMLVFLSSSGTTLAVSWRMLWVCSGVWSRGSIPVAIFVLAAALHGLAFLTPEHLHRVAAMMDYVALVYIIHIFFCDAAKRPFSCKVWMIMASVLGGMPFHLSAAIHTWLARTYSTDSPKVKLFGATIHLNTVLAGVLWTFAGFFTQKAGEFMWRRASTHGRKTFKIFEFTVFVEVAFTASGLQLFSGDTMMPYVVWALTVYAFYAALMTPAAYRRFPCGSTEALHVARLFVDLMAKAYGISVSLMAVMICTIAQRVLHPGHHHEDHVGPLTAPVVSPGAIPLWVVSVLLLTAAICGVSWSAKQCLSNAREELGFSALNLEVHSRQTADAVLRMAKEEPLALLFGVARVCLWRSRTEVRLIIAMQFLQMCHWYFVLSWGADADFWTAWEPHSSWFAS